MNCPECHYQTKVVFSESPLDERAELHSNDIVEIGNDLFGWWKDEFNMRERECCECNHTFVTIEVSIKDLQDAFAELTHESTIRPMRGFQSDAVTELDFDIN